MKNPSSKGYYVRVEGKLYNARTKKAQEAIRRAGYRFAPISRWDGFEWHDTGTVLHPAEAVAASPAPPSQRRHATKKAPAKLDHEINEALSRTFRILITAPRTDFGGPVRYTLTDKITPKKGGVEVETIAEGTDSGERFRQSSRKFHPGVALEAAAAYRLRRGYSEI